MRVAFGGVVRVFGFCKRGILGFWVGCGWMLLVSCDFGFGVCWCDIVYGDSGGFCVGVGWFVGCFGWFACV